MPLSFEQIQAAESARPDYIDVPVTKWGDSVRLMRLNAAQGVGIARRLSELPKQDDGQPTDESLVEFYVAVVSACAVDADGLMLFTADRQAVLKRDMAAINILGPAACKLNGFGEDIEKN